MKEAFKKVTAYRLTVFYTDDTPTETYYKATLAEAETYKEELLQEDESIESIDISEEPETIEAMNLDAVPELNTDVFPELDTESMNVGSIDDIPATYPDNMTAYENGLYNAAVNLMDDEIREDLHRRLAPCTDEEFLTAYKIEHKKKYGEEFKI